MDKREEIYEKALELFIAEGYEQTPLSRIAKALGITKAGLYYYFSSKEELLFFIHDRNIKRDLFPIIEAAEKIADPEERISYLIEHYTKASMTRDPSQRIQNTARSSPEDGESSLISFDILLQSWKGWAKLKNSTKPLQRLH